MTKMTDAISARMKSFGFSANESRVYVALLEEGTQNGNEIAKRALIPSSKVYPTLRKLSSEGFVQSSRHGSSTRWVAVPPKELISRLRRDYNDQLDFLESELPEVQGSEPSEPFLTVSGLEASRNAAISLIEGATGEIYLSCWVDDLASLREPLADADQRGVRIFGMLYGDAEFPAGSWHRHHYEDIVSNRVAGRLMALVADDYETLVARIPTSGPADAVRTRNTVMTLIVKEYLHHDTVLQRAQMSVGFEEWDHWWKADPDARSRILGRAFTPPNLSVGSD